MYPARPRWPGRSSPAHRPPRPVRGGPGGCGRDRPGAASPSAPASPSPAPPPPGPARARPRARADCTPGSGARAGRGGRAGPPVSARSCRTACPPCRAPRLSVIIRPQHKRDRGRDLPTVFTIAAQFQPTRGHPRSRVRDPPAPRLTAAVDTPPRPPPDPRRFARPRPSRPALSIRPAHSARPRRSSANRSRTPRHTCPSRPTRDGVRAGWWRIGRDVGHGPRPVRWQAAGPAFRSRSQRRGRECPAVDAVDPDVGAAGAGRTRPSAGTW